MNNLQQDVDRLIAAQTTGWEDARRNYAALEQVEKKTVPFDGFRIDVQFNPDRIRSTAAPDYQPSQPRPCFLCAENRPIAQQAVPWRAYDILINLYPIFSRHLTIPSTAKIFQFLTGKVRDMVDLAVELPDFVITFNGARSGASMPDHFHFQAVGKGALPAETELPEWNRRSDLYTDAEVTVWGADDYLRPAIVIEGTTAGQTARRAENVLAGLKGITDEADEAQVNALSWASPGKHTIVFFPRTAHRPRQYYAEGPDQFLSSPGAVDMGGVLITVRESDYHRVSVPLITDIFSQLVPDSLHWQRIKTELSVCLAKSRTSA